MVDINLMRIVHRVFSTPYKLRNAPTKDLSELVLTLIPEGDEVGDFNLALLDLGALVCQLGKPHCEIYPVSDMCNFFAETSSEEKKAKCKRKGRSE